ncbi:MAG: hypothetical protein M0Z53_13775 [Thermaerobacter sp.]|nr:hypothetical protein [Thermaerobacter sp.]
MIPQDNVSDKSWKAQWQTFLRQEVESLIQTVWERIPPSVRESVVELAEAETRVQTLSTRISQGVVTRWAAAHAADDAIPCCPTCGQSMRRVASDRPRAIIGFFGDYRLARAYYACTQGHGGNAPADRRWGLGPDHVSPKRGALAVRFAVEAPFDQASALLQAALGVTVDDETLRRIAHRVGGVAEAEEQAAIAAVAAGHGPDPKAASESPSALVVAVDGVMAQMTPKQWREGKIGVCLPLINDSSAPADGAGTESLLQPVGTPDYCIGFESRPEFWHRGYTHALQAGLDARSCRLVALLGDGAAPE